MALDNLQTADIIEALENFVERKRPPEHIRKKLDIGYKIEDQDVFIFEIRPQWNNPEIIREHSIAKATFVKTKNHWKVFWKRADIKWHRYEPMPTVKTIREFGEIVEKDTHHCFFG